MAHSAYARAAGLQSEVNKITVTRVAGNEVEYKRQLNLYRKDMMLTLNNITREEKRLQKSMRKYRGRMRENRRERKKRDMADYERDQRAMKNMSNVLVVETPSKLLVEHPPVQEGSPDSGIGEESFEGEEEQEGDKGEGGTDKLKSKKCVKRLNKGEDCNGNAYITLAVIKEDTEEVEEKSTTGDVTEGVEDSQVIKPEDDKLQNGNSVKDTGRREKTFEFPDIVKSKRLPAKTLRPKKQVVSFADLIKLQHSTSTKKLFDLVHKLAEKHGVKDEVLVEKEIRNIAALRSKDQGISDSMMRAASVLYPMKFGYMSTSGSDDDEPTTPSSTTQGEPSTDNSRLSSPREVTHSEVRTFMRDTHGSAEMRNLSRQTEPNLPSVRSAYPTESMKRTNSMPTLLDQVEKVQKAHQRHQASEQDTNVNRRNSMSKSSKSTPRVLPQLERKRMSMSNVYSHSSDHVSWTEAFGLLKGVHNLFD